MKLRILASIAAAGFISASAMADVTIDLGGGWSATIFDEERVDLIVDFIGNDTIVLQKFANFTEIDDFTGLPASLSIAFNQTGDDANTVSRIVFTDMFIANNTGVNWGGFREALLGDDASFNVGASSTFSINPFTNRTYSNGNKIVTFDGGTVADGQIWTPGLTRGALVIDVDLSDDNPAKFILKETPLVPAPGAIVLLGAAGMVARRRRRN
ncbi:MAG: PEP-CTERM sorting domain-containing protein [Phycisphaerales bacterium]